MTAATWHPNPGYPPLFDDGDDEDLCPPDLIRRSEADGARVMVELRNGRRPDHSWPVIGRPMPTRWSLTGCLWDIVRWRRA